MDGVTPSPPFCHSTYDIGIGIANIVQRPSRAAPVAWPSQDIAIAVIVLCIACKEGVGGVLYIAQ